MLRRRLSPLGKLALSCFESLPENRADTAVFCSEHGEVDRTVSLLDAIARHEDMSPTNFSLSVHNAIAGIYSIAHKYNGAINAICAGSNSLFTTLIEAYGLLEAGHEEVACLIYDEPLPNIYTPPHRLGREALAIALLITKATPGEEHFELCGTSQLTSEKGQTSFPGEEFIKCLLRPETGMSYLSDSHQWTLRRVN
ncbi:beta-ketoacyl synthase chain length factor [Pseudoteredinibacter isoporae]